MVIETAYNIGDSVWFMEVNRPISGIIDRISIEIKDDKTTIAYCGKKAEYKHYESGGFYHNQNALFTTKELLLASL